MKIRKKSAFTIIEAATVFVIIGAIIAITISSINLLNTSKLSSARVLTANSPVKFTDGVVLWLETLTDEGFENNENQDGSVVSSWKNIQPDGFDISFTQTTGSYRPTYVKDGINGLPAISFTASADNHLLSPINDYLSNKTDFSSFVVFKANISNSDTYARIWQWCGESVSCIVNIRLGDIGTEDQLVFQLSNGTYKYIASNNTINSGKAYIANSLFNGGGSSDTDKYKLYINNIEQSVTVFDSPLASITPTDNKTIKIGGSNNSLNYDGEIGELIIINEAISEKRRQEIYNYLAKKWSIK